MMKTQTVYLVDTENVNEIWVDAIAEIQPRDKVVAFYTDNSPKLSWERMADFAAKGCEFEAIGCHKGTNALDFQLVSYLGYMIASKRDCHYVIISNDKGYDPVSCFWQERGIQIKRQPIQTKMEKKASPQPVAKESVVLKIFKKVTGQDQAVRTQEPAAEKRSETRSAEPSGQGSGRTGLRAGSSQDPGRTRSRAGSGQTSAQIRKSVQRKERSSSDQSFARTGSKTGPGQDSGWTKSRTGTSRTPAWAGSKAGRGQAPAGAGIKDRPQQLASSKGEKEAGRSLPGARELQAVKGLSKSIPISKEADFRQSLNHLLGENPGNRVFEQLQNQADWKTEADRAYLANANGRLRNYVEIFLRVNELPQTDRPEICKLLRQADADHLADLHREFVKRFDDEQGTAYYKLFKGNLRVIQSMLKS